MDDVIDLYDDILHKITNHGVNCSDGDNIAAAILTAIVIRRATDFVYKVGCSINTSGATSGDDSFSL